MATNGSKGTGGRTPRTAAEERAERAAGAGKGGGSKDPEVLAGEIEKTREDLARSLDAIADRVSPKRVAKRTTKKISTAVKDGASDAVEAVRSSAGAAKEAVQDKTAGVKDAVQERTSGDSAAPGLSPSTTPGVPSSVPDPGADPLVAQMRTATVTPPDDAVATTGALAAAGDATQAFEPAGSELPPLRAVPPPSAVRSGAPREVVAGAVAAVVLLLLVLRRRRR